MKLVWFTDDRDPLARDAAQYLAGRGWRVILNDLSGESVAGCERVRVDLSHQEAVDAVVGEFGDALWGVVHSAPPPINGAVESAKDCQWQEGFESGALSSLLVTRAAGPRLAAMGRGAIVYLGSIHAEKPMGYGFLYTMGCAATQMLCREAALSYGGSGVHCVYVQRGVMEHDSANKSDISNLYSGSALRYPKKRMPEPESFRGLIEFLLSDAAAPLNGADLRADEGMVMYYGNRMEGAPHDS